MSIWKKRAAKSETVRAEENIKGAQKPSPAHKTAVAEATGASDKKTTKTTSPAAATHKSPARKTVNAAQASERRAEPIAVESRTFDAALYDEEIRKEAYCNWLRSGCPQGSENRDWLAAIEIVRARYEK
jgi:activator of HSP90 ATPase